jgi:hypothetical protein
MANMTDLEILEALKDPSVTADERSALLIAMQVRMQLQMIGPVNLGDNNLVRVFDKERPLFTENDVFTAYTMGMYEASYEQITKWMDQRRLSLQNGDEDEDDESNDDEIDEVDEAG